jgi:hypothetical protein
VVEGSSRSTKGRDDFLGGSEPNSASIDRSIDDSAALFPDSVPVRFVDFRALASEHAK